MVGSMGAGGPAGNGSQAGSAWLTAGSWASVTNPVPSAASYESQLSSIACPGASDCWAAGFWATEGGTQHALLEQYTNKWRLVNTPTVSGAPDVTLSGVACASAADCWTVGTTYTDTVESGPQMLIEHGTSTGWTISTTPASPTAGSSLNSVTCVSATDCWAVGSVILQGT
jgi:hypothetical protein